MNTLLPIVLVAAAFAAAPLHAEDLARVAWLANCWAAEGGESGSGEQWTVPAGGVMLGMARTVKGSKTTSFEFMRIKSDDGRLVFIAQPQGGPPVAFPAIEVTDDAVVFENPDNDFPQRVIYRLESPGVLRARIEGTGGAMDFPLRRVACDTYDPEDAAALMRAHLDNITRLAEAGSLIVAGPFLETDPAIQEGRLEMELHPWYGAAALQQLLDLYPRTTKQSH